MEALSRMTRLAIVRQKYNPAGGAERFVSRALQALTQQHALSVSLIARNWEKLEGIAECRVNPFYLGSLWRDWGFAWSARRRWQQEGFDLVQSHERIPGCHIFRAGDGVHRHWLQLRRRHLGWFGRLSLLLNPYHHYVQYAEKAMFQHPDLRLVVCNSHMVKQEIQQYFDLPDQRFAIVYNGVDTAQFYPGLQQQYRVDMRKQYGIPASAPVMLYVGSGFERKGVARALQVLQKFPEIHLVVVGGDKHAARYHVLAERLGMKARVRFTGAQGDVKPFYGMADAFILPTLYDPFPNVCVEAMAAGLPVFTTTTCGSAELLTNGRNGWVAAVDDLQGWHDGVANWLQYRQDWAVWCQQARQAVEGLTLPAMTDVMLQQYEKLLAAHTS